MNTTAAEHPVRARLGRWPDNADVAHLVLLDHHMVPDRDHVESWVADARAQGAATLRTGALFPSSAPAFLAAGFEVIDTLSLLELDDLTVTADADGSATTTSRPHGFVGFVRRNSTTRRSSTDTPSRRRGRTTLPHCTTSSPPRRDTAPGASTTTGRWWRSRSAVEHRRGAMYSGSRSMPSARRRGLARLLVADALDWMRRRNVERVLVNTATDNVAALALYRSLGFIERPERLTILERSLR